jgi:23S rRNA pseudouridine2605 synthase
LGPSELDFFGSKRFAGGVKRPATSRRAPNPADHGQPTGLARALSKLGFCSRREAWALIQTGRVCVNGTLEHDPERRVHPGADRIEVDGRPVRRQEFVYVMLNKPRGLITTARDERGRPTVFACLEGLSLPFVSPVGRLDQASEGLLLITNDTAWAARLTDPAAHVTKIYHVQIDRVADGELLQRLETGIAVDGEREPLRVRRARVLRQGEKRSWLELELDEGRNRHSRRLLAAHQIEVLRLVRVAIGHLNLGTLGKGQTRFLTAAEVRSLRGPGRASRMQPREPT